MNKKTETMDNGFLVTAVIAGVAIGAGVIFYLIKKNDGNGYAFMNWENKEMLELEEVTQYFKNDFKNIVSVNPKAKPIALKLTPENATNYSSLKLEQDENYPISIVLTYYDEEKEEILEKNTKAYRTKKLDANLRDSFGDKDMLVLS